MGAMKGTKEHIILYPSARVTLDRWGSCAIQKPTTSRCGIQNSGRDTPRVDLPTSTVNPVGATGEGSPTEHRTGSPGRCAVPLKIEEPTSAATWWLWDQREDSNRPSYLGGRMDPKA